MCIWLLGKSDAKIFFMRVVNLQTIICLGENFPHVTENATKRQGTAVFREQPHVCVTPQIRVPQIACGNNLRIIDFTVSTVDSC